MSRLCSVTRQHSSARVWLALGFLSLGACTRTTGEGGDVNFTSGGIVSVSDDGSSSASDGSVSISTDSTTGSGDDLDPNPGTFATEPANQEETSECGIVSASLDQLNPTIMLVLDQSGSMNEG